ncbi:hypothetical protein ACWIG5_14405 [Streptomyces lydicus]
MSEVLNRQVGRARPPLDGRSATFTGQVDEAPQQSRRQDSRRTSPGPQALIDKPADKP